MIKKILRNVFLRMQLLQDKLRGCDFAAPMDNQEIGIAPSEGVRYQATTPRIYQNLKRQLKNTGTEDAILDVGCGKGRMLYFFLRKCHFGKVDGLEYSERLAAIARQNMDKLHLDAQIYVENAAEFTQLDYNYFYLFNPFPEKIMQPFVRHLCESIEKNPRRVTILYMNPVCKDCFVENGFHTVSFNGGLMILTNQIEDDIVRR